MIRLYVLSQLIRRGI